jgi:hypothetical protein
MLFVVGKFFFPLFCKKKKKNEKKCEKIKKRRKKNGEKKISLHESPWLDDDDIVLVSF